VLAPDWLSYCNVAECLHFLALCHGGQNSKHRLEWRNYVTINLCIDSSSTLWCYPHFLPTPCHANGILLCILHMVHMPMHQLS